MLGGAIFARWQAVNGMQGPLGAPTSLETTGEGATRYVTFDKGPSTSHPDPRDAKPLTGASLQAGTLTQTS